MKKYTTILFLMMMVLSFSCTKEQNPVPDDNNATSGEASTVINILPNDILPVNMNTKANAENLNSILSRIIDLNIRVNLKNGKHVDYYLAKSAGDTIKKDGKNLTAAELKSTFFIDNKDFSQFTQNTGISLHCGDIIAGEIKDIQAIANANQDLQSVADWSTVKESGDEHLSDAEGAYCMMYGYALQPTGESTHITGKTCKHFQLTLKRTRALLTIVLNGQGLKDGVMIIPKTLRLHNVAKACTLTSLLPKGNNKITKAAEGMMLEKQIDLGALSNQNPKIGEHIDTNAPALPAEFYLNYLYENMQGTNANASGTAATKYPEGVKSVADAKDPAKNYKATYLEIVAEYRYKEGSVVKVGGNIIYRFFLGQNAIDNFDVEGNHYYKLNLNLKGFGGAKEDGKTDAQGNLIVNESDVSWRVDMETKEWGFEKDQFDFDGHYIDGATKVVGTNWKFNKVVKGDGNSSWLTINIQERYGQHWANPTTIVEQHCKLNIVNGELKFNLQPMVYMKNGQLDPAGQFDENTYKQPVNYREMQIEVLNLDNNKTQIITVRQYVPIPVTAGGETFFMERFEEYDLDPTTQLPILIPWGYNKNNLGKLKDLNNFAATYHWGNPNKNGVGLNSTYLRDKKLKGASFHCYNKGQSGVIQGAEVAYYALPSQTMMEAMFKMSATYDKSWGPFEMMHVYQDYWTSTVESAKPTETIFYDAESSTTAKYVSTADRTMLKRCRAVYTVHQW